MSGIIKTQTGAPENSGAAEIGAPENDTGLEAGGSVVSRSPDDIRQAIAQVGNEGALVVDKENLESGVPNNVPLPGDSVPQVAKSPEKVRREFAMLVGLVTRLVKGILAPAWQIPKSDLEEMQQLWADYLQEEFPQGVPATKLGLAIMATSSLIGAHIDEPRYHAPKEGQKPVGFFQRIFNAAAGRE